MTIRPPTKDVTCSTEEPDYDRSLFIRIFCPEGMEQTELKCSLSYSGNMFKTPILDAPAEEVWLIKIIWVMKKRIQSQKKKSSRRASFKDWRKFKAEIKAVVLLRGYIRFDLISWLNKIWSNANWSWLVTDLSNCIKEIRHLKDGFPKWYLHLLYLFFQAFVQFH